MYTKKPRGMQNSNTWVALMLIGMGLIFSFIAACAGFANITPEGLHMTRNGVPVEATMHDVTVFKLIFCGLFGVFGAVMLGIGVFVCVRQQQKKRLAERLLEDGVQVWATILDCEHTNVRVNHRYLYKLRCTYTDVAGHTYVFTSGSLRENPSYALVSGQVKVYYDRNDMKKYYVDVDGSLAPGGVTYL